MGESHSERGPEIHRMGERQSDKERGIERRERERQSQKDRRRERERKK